MREVKGKGKAAFVTLRPQESVRFEIAKGGFVHEDLVPPRRIGELRLLYTRNGHQFGVKGWLGFVDVQCAHAAPCALRPRLPRMAVRQRAIDNRPHGPSPQQQAP